MPSKNQHDSDTEDQDQDQDRHGTLDERGGGDDAGQMRGMHLRFAAMILTAMVVMYFVMFVGSWRWDHVRFSQSRIFMALTMGGTMGLIMFGWMRSMYKKPKVNIAIVIASIVLIAGGVALDRSQVTVDDAAFMRAMIPHHSLAITRSENAQLSDLRVCELAVQISEAQNQEIAEMEWLIEDIEQNGVAATPEEAAARPVPEFTGTAERDCSMP